MESVSIEANETKFPIQVGEVLTVVGHHGDALMATRNSYPLFSDRVTYLEEVTVTTGEETANG